MTGFDSEADRRDSIRGQIVQACVAAVRETIEKNSVTRTPEERHYLEMAVVCAMLKHMSLEVAMTMYRQEIGTAEEEIGS